MAYNSKYTGAQVEAQLDKVDGKQNIISDLATIRSGAALGATALQTETYKGTVTGIKMNGASKGTSGVVDLGTVITAHQDISGKADSSSLAKVATSGSYNDLSNKPTIPAAVTESTVSGWGFTKNTGTYSKPSTGIPKSDLASAVQTSLGKADTALQSYTEQYKGTVTGVKVNGSTKSPSSGTVDIGNVVTSVKINGSSKSPSSGVVDLGTVITAHQDISGKQDKLVSGTNIKTINGTSILGSGNIVISGGGGSSSGSGAYAEVNHGTSDTTFTLTPNTFHIWEEVSALTLTLGSETAGVANEFLFQFTSGATATSLTLPDDIKWANDSAPTIAENMIYQVSILKGLASVLEFSNNNSVMPITLYALDSSGGSSYTNPPSDNPNANKLYEELMSLSNNTGQGILDVGLVTLVLKHRGTAGSGASNNITSYSLAPSYISEGILLLKRSYSYYVLQQDGTIQSIFYD